MRDAFRGRRVAHIMPGLSVAHGHNPGQGQRADADQHVRDLNQPVKIAGQDKRLVQAKERQDNRVYNANGGQ